jgi:quinol-cytochrome oxidoreductase complex cytochrome b subunit
MIIKLLVITFILSFSVAFLVAWLFRRPVSSIMNRIVGDPLGSAWVRYLMVAMVVVGVGGGVRPWDYEKYITPLKDQPVPVLNSDRWVLEIYRTVIGSAQAITWLLLVFFVFALIAYVLLRAAELRQGKPL